MLDIAKGPVGVQSSIKRSRPYPEWGREREGERGRERAGVRRPETSRCMKELHDSCSAGETAGSAGRWPRV